MTAPCRACGDMNTVPIYLCEEHHPDAARMDIGVEWINAEAVMPEGWRLTSLVVALPPGSSPYEPMPTDTDWRAGATRTDWGDALEVEAPTPGLALQALAAALRERTA